MQQIGPYQVVGELGRGAAGVVYRAHDPRVAGREVAIKVLSAPPGQDSSAFERFLREAEVLARVHHGGVVRVHGFERHPGGAYLIQEIVEGVVLDDRIRSGPLAVEEAARIARGLADALTAVHRAGILHRDLKPGNVILRDGKPVLLDFGVARDANAETLTKSGAMLGTPAYMSPEQAAGEAIGTTADVYSVGVILYELLTGLRPFRGHLLAVVRQVLEDEPAWPSALGVDVPTELEAVLQTAMAKAPGDRYESAEALREELDCYLAGRPTQAGARLATRAGTRRGVLAAGLVCLIVPLVTASVWLNPWASQPAEPIAPPPAHPEPLVEPPPAPAEQLLWQLERGHEFQALLTFDERTTGQVRMDATLNVVVDWIEDETAYLTLSLPKITVRLGPILGDREAPRLSRAADGDTPLSRMIQDAMAPWICELDLRTGAASMSGLEEIQKRIRAQPEAIKDFEGLYTVLADQDSMRVDLAGTLCRIFSKEYLGASMDCLTRVVESSWRRSLERGRFAHDAEEDAPRLPFVQLDKRSQRAVRVEGSATYERGRLVAAAMQQSLVKRQEYSTRWTWTLLE